MQDILIFMQHNLALSLAAVAVLTTLIILEFIKIKKGTNRLSPQQAVQLMNHQNAAVIDIRKTDAFAKGHIVSSISLPFSDLQNKQKKIEKYRAQPVILVCENGVESQKAAAILEKSKFTNVQILDGGLRSWQQAGMPIIKD